jgi:dTDP-4-amino-4,6-dideoxygalactose transaminase
MITLAKPVLGEEERAAVERVLASGRLVLGPEAVAFERELEGRCGVAHAVVVSSGTAALHLALWALDVGPGDEVLVPALTFPAPAAAVLAVGARPVVVDVDRRSWNLSVEGTRGALCSRSRAIIGVDQFGVPAAWGPLEELAEERGVALVEDAACSIGASLDGRPCGAFGRVAALSFHPRKVITTGEGGALVTDDADLAELARSLRDHGREGLTFLRSGLNLRLGEMQAALGRCQLARLDDLVGRRRVLAKRYLEALAPGGSASHLGLEPQGWADGADPCFQTFAVRLPEGSAVGRDDLIVALAERGVEAQVASFSLGRLEPFARAAGISAPEELPEADILHGRGLALPLHPAMGDDDVDRVLGALEVCLDAAGE